MSPSPSGSASSSGWSGPVVSLRRLRGLARQLVRSRNRSVYPLSGCGKPYCRRTPWDRAVRSRGLRELWIGGGELPPLQIRSGACPSRESVDSRSGFTRLLGRGGPKCPPARVGTVEHSGSARQRANQPGTAPALSKRPRRPHEGQTEKLQQGGVDQLPQPKGIEARASPGPTRGTGRTTVPICVGAGFKSALPRRRAPRIPRHPRYHEASRSP